MGVFCQDNRRTDTVGGVGNLLFKRALSSTTWSGLNRASIQILVNESASYRLS